MKLVEIINGSKPANQPIKKLYQQQNKWVKLRYHAMILQVCIKQNPLSDVK